MFYTMQNTSRKPKPFPTPLRKLVKYELSNSITTFFGRAQIKCRDLAMWATKELPQRWSFLSLNYLVDYTRFRDGKQVGASR